MDLRHPRRRHNNQVLDGKARLITHRSLPNLRLLGGNSQVKDVEMDSGVVGMEVEVGGELGSLGKIHEGGRLKWRVLINKGRGLGYWKLCF